MESLLEAEKCQKELTACQGLLDEKDRELQALRQRVQLSETLQGQLETCQEQVKQLTAKNHGYKERLQAQEMELERQQAMATRINIEGQPQLPHQSQMLLILQFHQRR